MADNSSIANMDTTDVRHQCFIYKGSPSLQLSVLAQILKTKLDEGYRCLYLNSAPMVAGMRSTLAAMNIDVLEVTKSSLVLSSDPASPGGDFDSEVMLHMLERLLDQAIQDGYKGLWASGDMTWEFGPEKDFSKLMEYELGLERLFRRRKELCGICQYHIDTLPQDSIRQGLLIHPTLVINDTLRILNPHYLKSSWPVSITTREKLDEMITELSGQ